MKLKEIILIVLSATILPSCGRFLGSPKHEPGEIPTSAENISLKPQWDSIFKNILSNRCVICHNPAGQARFLDLSTRQALLNYVDNPLSGGQHLFNFAEPRESYFIEVITDPNEPMPPLNSGLSLLTESEVQVLIDWIAQRLP